MTARNKPSALTIVIKLGTSSIVSTAYPFLPHLQLLSSIVETVVQLRELGHRVVLVSSGAIGVGLRRMGLKERGKGLSHKQALAAIGQGRLIALWDNLFSQLDQPIAQILLTRMDISDRTRYLNAQNTFSELLQMGVVPIVNENDTVSVSEIKFGDNDTLSAISSNIVHADFLFLLTDVDCLYTDNPRINPDATPVRVVRDIEKVKQQVSTSTLGTSLGTGGMSTKLIAAELATAAGVTTVVMHSSKVHDIFGVIADGVGPSREMPYSEGEEDGPVCTRFLRRQTAINDRKWWIAHGLHVAGSVVIDEGAYRAIMRRESGGRLLPAGVVRVEGTFASHQAVRLIVRRRRKPLQPALPTSADSSAVPPRSSFDFDLDSPAPSSPSKSTRDFPTPQGGSSISLISLPQSSSTTGPFRSNRPAPVFTTSSTTNSSPDFMPLPGTPGTPSIQPALSLSSSIASLDPLSRSVPPSPAVHALSERFAGISVNGNAGSPLGGELKVIEEGRVLMQTLRGDKEIAEGATRISPVEQILRGDGHEDEWEEVEVGKGLAQYNSVEIDRVKGMKSSHIEQVLGYSESDHVVDSITFL